MSISRRFFVKAGAMTVIAAGISLQPHWVAFGQDLVDKMGAPDVIDPLANYTQATFVQYVNSIFRLRGPNAVVDVTLTKVEDTLSLKTPRAGGRESFALFFRGGGVSLPQNTYTVEHAALGTFSLFLVPNGADENGAQGYTAIINRLSYTAKPAGRKPPGPKRSNVRPPQGIPETEQARPPKKGASETEQIRPIKKGSRDPEELRPHQLDN